MAAPSRRSGPASPDVSSWRQLRRFASRGLIGASQVGHVVSSKARESAMKPVEVASHTPESATISTVGAMPYDGVANPSRVGGSGRNDRIDN